VASEIPGHAFGDVVGDTRGDLKSVEPGVDEQAAMVTGEIWKLQSFLVD